MEITQWSCWVLIFVLRLPRFFTWLGKKSVRLTSWWVVVRGTCKEVLDTKTELDGPRSSIRHFRPQVRRPRLLSSYSFFLHSKGLVKDDWASDRLTPSNDWRSFFWWIERKVLQPILKISRKRRIFETFRLKTKLNFAQLLTISKLGRLLLEHPQQKLEESIKEGKKKSLNLKTYSVRCF